MANLNDFKILKIKCIKCFNLAKNVLDQIGNITYNLYENYRERYGFYYFILQNFTSLTEYTEMTDCICDTDFNNKFFKRKEEDVGIDAVYIDENNKCINIFNFKYRNKFNPDKEQCLNDAITSSKFFNVLLTQKNDLDGKSGEYAKKILEKFHENEIWNIIFYFVSNDNKTLSSDNSILNKLKEVYSMNIKTIGLDEITDVTSLKHDEIGAKLILPDDAILTFSENRLSSDKSYIVRLPIYELIRITCNDPSIREKYNNEDDQAILNAKIEMQVLYDNVRGLILRSKFNKNIEKTLDNEPGKFFFYNNGITIVAKDINATISKTSHKTKLEIIDFQVLNGGQTLRTIYNYISRSYSNVSDKLSNAEVLVRFLKIPDDEERNYIGEYTNSQNAIDQRDLKSLRKEQLQLEEYLDGHDILYIRKKGDTGKDDKTYHSSISMERMGQILMAIILKRPDQISNKKRYIFDTYYDKLFVQNEELCSENTIQLINDFNDIGVTYRQISNYKKYGTSYQKDIYILYLSYYTKNKDFKKIIEKFENCLTDYSNFDLGNNKEEKDKAKSRYLINSSFKIELDKQFKINS